MWDRSEALQARCQSRRDNSEMETKGRMCHKAWSMPSLGPCYMMLPCHE